MDTVIVRHRITGGVYPWPPTLAAEDPDLEVIDPAELDAEPEAEPATEPAAPRRTRTPRTSGDTATTAADNTEAEKEAADS